MKRKLKITKGNQYNRDGFLMTDGITRSWGEADSEKPDGYSLDGNCWVGADYIDYQNQIDAAILATMQDGQERVIQMKTQSPQTQVLPPDFRDGSGPVECNPCPKCGTYCMGDCEAVVAIPIRKKTYCTQNDGDCETCALVNYGRDCMNQPIA